MIHLLLADCLHPWFIDRVIHIEDIVRHAVTYDNVLSAGTTWDENSKEYKLERKKCDKKLRRMFQSMRAMMSIPVFK